MGERRTRYERLKIDSNLFNPENVQIRTVLGGGGGRGSFTKTRYRGVDW